MNRSETIVVLENREIEHHVLRQTLACSYLPLLFSQMFKVTPPEEKKNENNSRAHDKRENTHFQKWDFCRSRVKQTRCFWNPFNISSRVTRAVRRGCVSKNSTNRHGDSPNNIIMIHGLTAPSPITCMAPGTSIIDEIPCAIETTVKFNVIKLSSSSNNHLS